MKKILVIEDDPAITIGLEASLKEAGYSVVTAADGISGFAKALDASIDLVLLDIMLPGKDGMEICRELRKQNNPVLVLMLTSKNEEIDKVLGLEIGADDYVTKPFSIRELLARIKALLRRSSELKTGIEHLAFGAVKVDFTKHELSLGGLAQRLSTKEFQILKFFIEREGHVVTRDMLLDSVWGYTSFPTTRTLDNYILSLRKKIEREPSPPKHLLTVHTSGYRFVLHP